MIPNLVSPIQRRASHVGKAVTLLFGATNQNTQHQVLSLREEVIKDGKMQVVQQVALMVKLNIYIVS